MQFKLFVVALLEACVLQVTFTQAASEVVVEAVAKAVVEDDVVNRRSYANNFKTEAYAAVKKVTVSTKNIFNRALNSLNNLKNQFLLQVNRDKEAASKQLKDVIGKADRSIKEILDKATELGIDISACVSNKEKGFKQILGFLLSSGIRCINDSSTSAINIINDNTIRIKNAFNSITDLSGDLAECQTSVSCITNVIYEVGKLQLQVPAQIAKSIYAPTQLVAGLQKKLPVCCAIQVARAGVETAKIVAHITKCALAKGVKHFKKL